MPIAPLSKNSIQDFLRTAPQWSQRQDDVTAQLRDLHALANKFGLYDAADIVRYNVLGDPKYVTDLEKKVT
jgi:uncharacterized protein (UPF0297 family)